jgi:hypothetical protein
VSPRPQPPTSSSSPAPGAIVPHQSPNTTTNTATHVNSNTSNISNNNISNSNDLIRDNSITILETTTLNLPHQHQQAHTPQPVIHSFQPLQQHQQQQAQQQQQQQQINPSGQIIQTMKDQPQQPMVSFHFNSCCIPNTFFFFAKTYKV